MNLDVALRIASDTLTTILAAIGIVVSIHPPEKEGKLLRRSYIGAFIVTGLLLVGSNYWQAIRNSVEQTRVRAENGKAQKLLQDQNAAIQAKLDVVVTFVNIPPGNLNQSQVASAVRHMTLSNISNSTLAAWANDLAGRIQAVGQIWLHKNSDFIESLAKTRDPDRLKQLQDDKDRVKATAERDIKSALSDANSVRVEVIRRKKAENEEDKRLTLDFENPQRPLETFDIDSDYMRRLANRLSP